MSIFKDLSPHGNNQTDKGVNSQCLHKMKMRLHDYSWSLAKWTSRSAYNPFFLSGTLSSLPMLNMKTKRNKIEEGWKEVWEQLIIKDNKGQQDKEFKV